MTSAWLEHNFPLQQNLQEWRGNTSRAEKSCAVPVLFRDAQRTNAVRSAESLQLLRSAQMGEELSGIARNSIRQT